MTKSAVNALYKLLRNLNHYCPHKMFPANIRRVQDFAVFSFENFAHHAPDDRVVVNDHQRWHF